MSCCSCGPVSGPYWYGLLLIGGLLLLFTTLFLFLVPFLHVKGKRGFSSRWYNDYIGLLVICICFYVAWGFGLPATRPLNLGAVRIVFQVIFIVSNILLGLTMIITYCLLSEQVRALCHTHRQYDISEFSRQPVDDNQYAMTKKDDEGLHFENQAADIDALPPPPEYDSLQIEGEGAGANGTGPDTKAELEAVVELEKEETSF